MRAAKAWADDWERRLAVLSLVVCGVLFLFHCSLVWYYAVDVPFWDEWAMFSPDQLPAGFSLRSIGSQHLEHRFATTKLLIWLQYAWNGWDVALHQRLNFLLFGVLLASIAGFVKNTMPDTPWWLIMAFLVFVLSPINWLNHFMAYQTSTHLYVLLTFLVAWLIFKPDASMPRLLTGGMVCCLLIFTSAAGAAATGTLGAVFVAYELNALRRGRPSAGIALRIAAVVVPIGLAGALWLHGYRHDPDFPALTPPTSWSYWAHWFAVVALGFGFELKAPLLGLVCVLAVIVPLAAARRARDATGTTSFAPFAVVLALLAGAAAVSLGRASLGAAQARSPRYAEYVLPLVPLTAAAWYAWLAAHRREALTAVATLWVICALSFADDWLSFRFYAREADRRNAGLSCVAEYYDGTGSGTCETIFPADHPIGLASLLDSAKALNASFYRKMVAARTS